MLLPPSGTLRVFAFAVGPGDHLLAIFPDQTIGIVDFCYDTNLQFKETDGQLIQPPAISLLKYLKCEEKPLPIKLLHISHPDADHVRGLDKFLTYIKDSGQEMNHFWWFGRNDDSKRANILRSALRQYQIELVRRQTASQTGSTRGKSVRARSLIKRIGELIQLENYVTSNVQVRHLGESHQEDGWESYAVAPTAEDLEDYFTQLEKFIEVERLLGESVRPKNNQVSTALLWMVNKARLIWGGDVTEEGWENAFQAVKTDKSLLTSSFRADWVKVSHHGSRDSSSPQVWDQLMDADQQAVWGTISAGLNRQYKHPHDEMLMHFFQKARDKQLKPILHATNICYECLKKRVPEEIDLNPLFSWEIESQKKLKEGIKKQPGGPRVSQEKDVYHETDKSIAALIYDFSPDGTIETKLGATTLLAKRRGKRNGKSDSQHSEEEKACLRCIESWPQ